MTGLSTDRPEEPPKKPRRQYGTGGITQRKDGLWMGRVEAGYTSTGKRRRPTVYGKTEAEVKRKLEAKRKQIAREGKSVSTKTRASVKSWAEKWLEQRATGKRPKTYATDKWAVGWVIDTIGTRKLESLTPDDIRSVVAKMDAAGIATSSQLRVHRTLHRLAKDAILDGHDVPQRVLLVPSPGVGESDRTEIEINGAIAMLQAASWLPHASRWAGAFLQGIRPNEALGLTWDHVDLARGTVTVAWQLQELRYADPKDRAAGFVMPKGYKARHLAESWHLVEVKSKAGYRVIPMVPWFRDALTAWRDVVPLSPHALVWPDTDGGPARTKDDTDEWRGLQDTAGWLLNAPVRHASGRYYVRHEARHTTATLLLEAGVDPKIIMQILGQSTIATTRGYQHVRTELALQALEQVAHSLQLGQTQPRPEPPEIA